MLEATMSKHDQSSTFISAIALSHANKCFLPCMGNLRMSPHKSHKSWGTVLLGGEGRSLFKLFGKYSPTKLKIPSPEIRNILDDPLLIVAQTARKTAGLKLMGISLLKDEIFECVNLINNYPDFCVSNRQI